MAEEDGTNQEDPRTDVELMLKVRGGDLHALGMLFIDFETPQRLRLQGTATVQLDDPLLEHFPEADLMVRVAVEAVFANFRHVVRVPSTRTRLPNLTHFQDAW